MVNSERATNEKARLEPRAISIDRRALSSSEFRIQLRGAKRFRIHATAFREYGRQKDSSRWRMLKKAGETDARRGARGEREGD